MKKISVLLVSILFSFNFAGAQYAYQQTLYNNVPQARYTNTGIMPEYKGYFSIPLLSGYGLTASNSGFSFNDLFENGNISPESLLNAIKDKNLLKVGNSLDVIAFGFKVGKNFISFNVSPKTDINLGYNKSVFDFILNGNASYIGKSISLDGFSLDASAYIETGLGYTREINDKLSAGGRLKLLSGLGNVKGDFNGVSLFTDSDDYSLTATSNFSINAYGTFFGDDEIAEAMGNPSYFNPNNLGIGIDLGASYQFSEKLNFFGNIVDLGYLKWSEYGETLYNDGVPFKFEGLPVDELIGSDNNSDLVGDLMDTLNSTFNLKRSQLSYTTALKTKLFAGASYDLNNFITFQGMLHGRVYNKRVYPMYMFAGGINLKKWLTAKLTYNGTNKTYDNIGAGLVLNAGAFQFYAMVDNIYGLSQIDYTRNLAGSFGFNIVFQENKESARLAREEIQSIKDKSENRKDKSENRKDKAEKKKDKAQKKKDKAEKRKKKAEDSKEKAEKKKEKAEDSKEKAEKKKDRAEDKKNSNTTNKKESADQIKARQKSLKSAAREIEKEGKELKKEIKSEKEKEKELKSEAKDIKEEVKQLKKETKEVKAKEKELKSIAKESNLDAKEVDKELKAIKAKEKQLKSAVKDEKSEAREIKKEIKNTQENEKELKSEAKDQKSEVKQIKKEIKDLKVNDSGLKSEVKVVNEKSKVIDNNTKEINYESTSDIPYSEIIKKDSVVKIQSNEVNLFKDSIPAMVMDSLGIIDSLKLEPKGGGL